MSNAMISNTIKEMLWLHIETKDVIEANKLNIVHEGNRFLDNLPFYDGI